MPTIAAPMSLVFMLLLGLLLLLGVVLWTSAKLLLQPPRMTAGKALYLLKRITPDDLGIRFEPVDFTVRDSYSGQSLKLAAWWMPHPAGGSRTVALIHGYADAKVGALAWAPLWQQLGYHILAFDQRAHGESEGRYCTGGVLESDDLMQLLDALCRQRPTQTQTLVLFGISLGASPALAVAGRRNDLAAVVADCPFRDFANAVSGLARQLKLPLPSLLPATLRLAAWIAKADLHRVDNLPLIGESRCPLLLLEAEIDPYVSGEDARALEEAVNRRGDASQFYRVDGSSHLRAFELDPAEYERRLATFLESLASGD